MTSESDSKQINATELSPPNSNMPSQNFTIDQALAAAYGHWNAGQANQAELLCQRVLAAWPGNHDALHLLGLMSFNWGNLDLAIDYLRKACQSPRAPAVYFSNLAEMSRQKGLLREGEAAARTAVAMDASLVGGWNNLGIILQEAGKYEEALTCLQRVLSLKQDCPETYNNLANTFKQMGRLDRAQACYVKALELAPNYAEAHSNLSNLLKEFGQFNQALAEAKLAIDINPRLADAYINAAAVETARLHPEEALRWLNALLAFAPTNALALVAKSVALDKLDRHEEALEVAQNAITAAPENGDAHNALGQALQSLGHYSEALLAYDIATEFPSMVPEQGYIGKGVLLMEINRPEEAGAEFIKAIEVNPRSARAYFNLADLKSFQRGDKEIVRMEEMLERNEVQSHSDRMALHFALGKALMDSGDNERAFAFLNEGNRMKRSVTNYDADATESWIESIIAAFPQALFKNSVESDAKSDLPIFIVGIPRSGTTLIEQILSVHPDVMGAGELSAMSRIANRWCAPDGHTLAYPKEIASALSSPEATRIGKTYLAEVERLSQGCKHVVDKMPSNFLYAGLIALCLPGARIIHCRRDPVDTCLSCYTKLFTAEQNFTYDLTELGRFYRAYERLMAHWKKVLPPQRFIEVDYEAVVDDLETEAKRLVNFCDLKWNDACLEFHKSNRPIHTASVNQVRQPIYKRSIGRWKRYAPYLGPLLETLGIRDSANKSHEK